ncbi:MAG: serpin family protein [Candidatus Woesearchaeota archaeon]
MAKKIVLLSIVFLIVLTTAMSIHFLFSYDPYRPLIADETGSTLEDIEQISDPYHPLIANETSSTLEGIEQVINANNKFAFDLFNGIEQNQNNNLFFSPYSISVALAMTYEGAKEQTAQEMRQVFYFPEKEILRSNSASFYNTINEENKSFTLRTGNALWIQKDFPLLDEYVFTIQNYYGGKASNLDFVQETEPSRQTINSFIEKQTNNRIKELIKPGMLRPDTKLVITNAIYFLGDWKYQFDKKNTRDRDFFITPNNPIKVPMMHLSSRDLEDVEPQPVKFNYAELEKVQIIELPYKGDQLSMIIILPKQYEKYDYRTDEIIKYNHTLDDIDISLEAFTEYKSQMRETSMDSIYLPLFEFETDYTLNDILKDLGMPTAFTPDADFSGITGKRDLFFDLVIHKAFIKADERGTESAAATAVLTLAGSIPVNVFNANNPFIFIIQENETENILFMGRVADPTK